MTVLSAMAMVSGLAVVPFQLGSGIVSDHVSPLFALAVAGVVLICSSLVILSWETPIERGSDDRDGPLGRRTRFGRS